MKQSICFHIKENSQLPTPCWASSVLQFQHAGWCSTQRLLSFRALSLQPSWVLICPNHLWGSSELQPTGAEMGFITAAPVLAHFSLLLYLSASLFGGTSQARFRNGSQQPGPPHHSAATICHFFFFFHTRWSLLWSEMSSPKMKLHKSSVINLLVRLLQLSPGRDIWTADWLMPAVGLERGSLPLTADPTVGLSVGF